MGNVIRNRISRGENLNERREFLEVFLRNNRELRDMGLLNLNLPNPQFFKKPKIKKSKIFSLNFDIKNISLNIINSSITLNLILGEDIDLDIILNPIIGPENLKIQSFFKKLTYNFKSSAQSNINQIKFEKDILDFLKSNKSLDILIKLSNKVKEKEDKPIIYSFFQKSSEKLFINSKKILKFRTKSYLIKNIYDINSRNQSGIELENLNESMIAGDKLCSICFYNKINILMLPCRHYAICLDCSKQLRVNTNKCPICRVEIKTMVRLFKK